MKKTLKASKFPFVITLFIVSFIACDKDFNVIESDVLGNNNLNFNTDFETIPAVAYNKKLDSLQVNGLNSNLLGVFNDPAYGTTVASIITQVIPTSFNPNFGVNPAIDSVVVNIPYFSSQIGIDSNGNAEYRLDSLYGNSSNFMKLTIYQSDYFLRDFNPNSTVNSVQNFYSNANSTFNSVLTGAGVVNFDNHIVSTINKDEEFLPDASPTITKTGTGEDVVETRSAPSYRLSFNPVDNPDKIDYWTQLIIDKQDDPVLSNTNNFVNYFRGLYFKVEPLSGDGKMVLLNLASTNANIIIYYTQGETDNRSQLTYTLNFNRNRVNTFINDYNQVSLINGNKNLGDEKLYLKGTSGSMAVVELFGKDDADLEAFLKEYRLTDKNDQYIKDDRTGNFLLKKLINEAHLEIYEDENINIGSYSDKFHRYDRIYAYDINNNRPTIDYLFDFTENTQSPLSSKIISLSQRDTINKNYKIRLTEHINNIILRDSTNTKIGLVLTSNVNSDFNQNTGRFTISDILDSDDDVSAIPSSSIISPRGTILYGSNSNVPEGKKLKLKIFFTEPKT